MHVHTGANFLAIVLGICGDLCVRKTHKITTITFTEINRNDEWIQTKKKYTEDASKNLFQFIQRFTTSRKLQHIEKRNYTLYAIQDRNLKMFKLND